MSGGQTRRVHARRQFLFALIPALVLLTADHARAQGASDNQSEQQVQPQIVQNPIIPGLVDPEPPFTTAKQDAVLTRPRNEYAPIGMEAGGVIRNIKYLGRGQILESFLLFPKVETSVVFDSNIFADANNKTADFIGTVKPELTLQSNWDNHAFFIRGFGEFGRFLSNSRENFRRHGVEIGGRADITEFLRLTPSIGWQRKTAARSDIDADAGGDEPTVFYESFGEVRLDYKRDKFLYAGRSKITAKDFVDSPAGIGEIENDQNDNWLWENSHRFGWEWWRGSTFFVQPFLNVNRFFINPDNSGVTRGFTNYGAVLGYTYDLTAVTFFEGSLGLGFASPRDRNADDFLFLEGALDLSGTPTIPGPSRQGGIGTCRLQTASPWSTATMFRTSPSFQTISAWKRSSRSPTSCWRRRKSISACPARPRTTPPRPDSTRNCLYSG